MTDAKTAQPWRCGACGKENPPAAGAVACGCGALKPDHPRLAAAAAAGIVTETRGGRALRALSWGYAAVVLAALGLIHGVGDGWWPVVPLLFMPRWLFLTPAVLLAVASGVRRCPGHWWIQGAAAAVVAGPLMGASFAVQRLWEPMPAGDYVRIATYNLGGDPIRTDELKQWVALRGLDVVCFQEGGTDERRLRPELPDGWQYSPGAYLATRLPVVAEYPLLAEDSQPGRRYSGRLERVRLRARSGREFVVGSVHMPSLRPAVVGLLTDLDAAALRRQTAWWGREMARVLAALAESSDVPVLIGGDFNMPADDSTMAGLRASFRFAFEEGGGGYGYTRPSRLSWVRIDHILAGPQWYVVDCQVGPDFGSDHLPLHALVVLPDGAPAGPPGPP